MIRSIGSLLALVSCLVSCVDRTTPTTASKLVTDPQYPAPSPFGDQHLYDSPFEQIDFSDGYFYRDYFEDDLLEHLDVQVNRGDLTTFSFSTRKRNDISYLPCFVNLTEQSERWSDSTETLGVIWAFNSTKLKGKLPTHVGIASADNGGPVTFEAFDSLGISLGKQLSNGADTRFTGQNPIDRFYSVVNKSGIAAVKLSIVDHVTDIEIDHLEWGYQSPQL